MTMRPLFSSLSAFISAGLHPRTALAKAIVLALVIKLCLVVAMRIFLFSGEMSPAHDSDAMARLLFGTASAANERAKIHD